MLTMAAFPLPMLRVPFVSMVSRVLANAFKDCKFDVVTVPHGSVVVNVPTTTSPVTMAPDAYTFPVVATFPTTSTALEAVALPTANVLEIVEFDVLIEVRFPAILMVSPGPPMLIVVAPPPFFPMLTVSM